jgi:hypothetical protein
VRQVATLGIVRQRGETGPSSFDHRQTLHPARPVDVAISSDGGISQQARIGRRPNLSVEHDDPEPADLVHRYSFGSRRTKRGRPESHNFARQKNAPSTVQSLLQLW